MTEYKFAFPRQITNADWSLPLRHFGSHRRVDPPSRPPHCPLRIRHTDRGARPRVRTGIALLSDRVLIPEGTL